MNAIRNGMPIFLILVSIFFFVNTLNIQTKNINNPNEPIYFPLIASIGLFIFSLAYFVQERRKQQVENEDLEKLTQRGTLKIILTLVTLALVYTLIFELVGFLISTIFFLGAILFFLNGRKKWVLNVSVALLSSFTFWYLFDGILKVNLP